MIVLKNSKGEPTGWMSDDVSQMMIDICLKAEANLLDPNWKPRVKTPEEEYRSHVKYALVMIGEYQQVIYMNNEDMKGYEFYSEERGYFNTSDFNTPLIPVEYDSFIRWARGMDL